MTALTRYEAIKDLYRKARSSADDAVQFATDTSWFHRAAEKSSAICFTRGQINFNKPDSNTSSPTNDQAFFYFVPRVNQFTDVFGQHGLMMMAA